MPEPVTATTQNVSLYPSHVRGVVIKAREAGLIRRTRYFSPALQLLIEEWAALKGVDLSLPSHSEEQEELRAVA